MDVRHSVADPTVRRARQILGFHQFARSRQKRRREKSYFRFFGRRGLRRAREPFPAAEDHVTRPASPYGVSKRAGELYLSYYHQAFGLPYIALRYANVYGPRQSTKGEAGVVAIFISLLLAGQKPGHQRRRKTDAGLCLCR